MDAVVVNNGKISKELINKYADSEQKDLVEIDYENIKTLGAGIIEDNYVLIENGYIRHNTMKVSIDILSYLLD